MFHLHAKIISRSDGRSATAAAAYRSASRIEDIRTGLTWDFTVKRNVHTMPVILPEGAPPEFADRATLWNAIEVQARRKDAQVAREIEVALPHGLTPEGEDALIQRFGEWLVMEYGVAVDPCIHRPPGNHHAHLLTTTSRIQKEGIGPKVRALDHVAQKKNDATADSPIEAIRAKWEELVNQALEGTGRRVDRRTLADQGIDRAPQRHQGPTATAIARRGGSPNRSRMPRQPITAMEDQHEAQPRPRRRRAEPVHSPKRQPTRSR